MRINMGGSGASGDTRNLEVRTLITAAQARAKDYEELKTQFQELKRALQQITGFGRTFQGKGADAIKQFYRAQADVVDTWLDLIDQQIAYYRSIPGAIDKNIWTGKPLSRSLFLRMIWLPDIIARRK